MKKNRDNVAARGLHPCLDGGPPGIYAVLTMQRTFHPTACIERALRNGVFCADPSRGDLNRFVVLYLPFQCKPVEVARRR